LHEYILSYHSSVTSVGAGVGAEEFQEVLAALVHAAEDIFEAVLVDADW
jgi:DDE superfamily endonuclease